MDVIFSTPKEIHNSSVTLTKDGVDIWMTVSGNTWVISTSSGPGMTKAELDSAAAAFKANAAAFSNKVAESEKSMDAMKKAEDALRKAAEEYMKEKKKQ